MIIKILAIGVSFYSCIYFSKYLTKGLEKRLDTLDGFYQNISLFFQMAIKQEKDLLYVFEKLSKSEDRSLCDIYVSIYNKMKLSPYQKIDKVWCETIGENGIYRAEKEDIEIILDFAYVLSSLRSVKAGSDFERYITRLYEYVKRERYEVSKKKQLYKKFGIVIGLFFGILLI